MTTQPH